MSILTSTLDFESNEVLSKVQVTSKLNKTVKMSMADFWKTVAEPTFSDSGILPIGEATGLLMVRTGLNHLQLVLQIAPGIYTEIWGESEGDEDAVFVELAQPYKIIIADFIGGKFIGARHFWSPIAVKSLDTPLYHVPLPNTNCRGYNGTSVGWMCLYHYGDQTQMTLAERIAYVYERASGNEAYNDANMSETDGPRYYADNGAPPHICTREGWAAKTKEDGCEWVMDASLMLPVMVKSIDDQGKGDVKNGIHLTLGGAINGTYNAYYPHRGEDIYPLKPISALQREMTEQLNEMITKFGSVMAVKIMNNSVDASAGVSNVADVVARLSAIPASDRPLGPVFKCASCLKWTPEEEATFIQTGPAEMEHWCAQCFENNAVRVDRYYWDPEVTERDTHFMFIPAGSDVTFNGVIQLPRWLDDPVTQCPSCHAVTLRRDPHKIGLDIHVYTWAGGVSGCVRCTLGHYWSVPLSRFVESTGTAPKLKTEMVGNLGCADGWSRSDYSVYMAENIDPCFLVENGGAFFNCACDKYANKNRMTDVTHKGKTVCDTCVSSGKYAPMDQLVLAISQPTTVTVNVQKADVDVTDTITAAATE